MDLMGYLKAATDGIIKGREDLECSMDKERREAFLGQAAAVWASPAFHDVLSRIAFDAQEFIVHTAMDMESVHAHRAVLIVVQTLKEQFESLARQYDSERQEAGARVEAPHSII